MSALQVLCIILLLINVAELLGLIIRQQMASTPVIPPVYLFVPGVQGFLMVSKEMFALHSTTLVLFQSHLFAFMFNDIVSNFELYERTICGMLGLTTKKDQIRRYVQSCTLYTTHYCITEQTCVASFSTTMRWDNLALCVTFTKIETRLRFIFSDGCYRRCALWASEERKEFRHLFLFLVIFYYYYCTALPYKHPLFLESNVREYDSVVWGPQIIVFLDDNDYME